MIKNYKIGSFSHLLNESLNIERKKQGLPSLLLAFKISKINSLFVGYIRARFDEDAFNSFCLYHIHVHEVCNGAGLELPGDLGDIVAFGRLTSPYALPAAKSKSLYFIRSRSVNYRRRSVK